MIEEIEGLLIDARQLASSIETKQGGNKHTRDILVFNAGKGSGSRPEVSTMNGHGDAPD